MTDKKKAAPKDSTLNNLHTNNNTYWQPCKLNKNTLQDLLTVLPSQAKQAQRMLDFLAKHPMASTVEVNVAAAAVNLSDVARKYNLYIESKGYKMACVLPPKPLPNRFGEASGMYLWSVYRLKNGEAANDDE